MTTNETPLTDIAHLLPKDAAVILLGMPDGVPERTLETARGCIAYWEANGYEFDPVQFEGILNALVAVTSGTHALIAHLVLENAKLQSKLLAAELRGGGSNPELGGSHG